MSTAWGKILGIGVDTHVHRISQRLGWVNVSKDPYITKIELEKFIPRFNFIQYLIDLIYLENYGLKLIIY